MFRRISMSSNLNFIFVFHSQRFPAKCAVCRGIVNFSRQRKILSDSFLFKYAVAYNFLSWVFSLSDSSVASVSRGDDYFEHDAVLRLHYNDIATHSKCCTIPIYAHPWNFVSGLGHHLIRWPRGFGKGAEKSEQTGLCIQTPGIEKNCGLWVILLKD